MQNDKGEIVDTYIPRKCSSTNQILTAHDHSSVQFNIGHINQHGWYTGEYTTVAFSGFIRNKGESDQELNRIAAANDLIQDISKFRKAGQ